MSVFVLDTDHVTLFRFGHEKVVSRVLSTPSTNLATSVITVEELLTGWYTRIRKTRDQEKVAIAYDGLWETVEFLKTIRILPFSRPAVERYSELRTEHRRSGRLDLAIAAIVLEEKAILITRNRRDFEKIDGLVMEDWSQ